MIRRVIIFGMLGALTIPIQAGGPFSRRGRSSFNRRSLPRTSKPAPVSPYRHLMNSPQKLTQLFGPSILIRDEAKLVRENPANARFVTQPDD